MRQFSPIFIIAFILAFCSITYELLLGQILSAYLGNTVLRYSVTVGLYMLSMGIGSLLAGDRLERKPILFLLYIEILLTVIGGSVLLVLSWLSGLGISSALFSTAAHTLIIIIGILTGFEIPLLMYIRQNEKKGSDNIVLGIDYIGAFFGAVTFAFYFYPETGLVQTSFIVAFLNAVAGLMLWFQKKHLEEKHKKPFIALCSLQCLFALLLIVAITYVEVFREYLIQQFLIS